MVDSSTLASLDGRLVQIVGSAHVARDESARAFMSQDIWAKGALASLVVAPANADELARVVATATAQGARVLPRGAGMSYTGGYASNDAGGIVIDTRRMTRILDISPQHMTVTVECGVTWQQLHEALTPHGLRTPFWGPLSGISSTIGGGLSQNNAFFGAGTHGPTSESVVSIAVVLADGSVLRTGTAGRAGGAPFFRHDGPDLTGLFVGDCGAFGVKAEATFRLIPRPEYEGWLSFSFREQAPCARAMAEIARLNVASELFGFDPSLARVRMRRASLLEDAGTLARVVSAQRNIFEGVKEGAKMALAGRSFLDAADFSVHSIVEGGTKAGVDADVAKIRKVIAKHGGKEVENTIPKVMRAAPFTPLNNILGPGGERWAPVHGIVAMGDGEAAWAAIEAMFAEMRPRLDAADVQTGYLVTTLGTTGFLIEPVFFWPEERFAIHDATIEAHYLPKLAEHAPNPATTALVAEARAKVVETFAPFSGAHFQIGRTYPYAQTRAPETLALIKAMKAALDPKGLMNPGVLGL
jgi:FAD/FMN-containing dehydrogenase